MTPDQISTILGALDRLEGKIDLKADKDDVKRLEGKVDKTNGRVTKIEAEQIREEATDAAKAGLKGTIWRASLAIVGAFTAIASVLVAVLK